MADQKSRLGPVRRMPVQERSNDTVQQIFRAASELLGRLPLEQITTSRIAAQGGVSIGALYRFFPDKQAIIDAIAVRHVQDLVSFLQSRLAESPPESGAAFLDIVVSAYVDFLNDRPDFRAIALGRHVSAATRQQQAEPGAGPAALVRMFMVACLGMEDSEELDLKLRIAMETGERLIAFAYTQTDEPGRAQVIGEMKRLLSMYLFPPLEAQ